MSNEDSSTVRPVATECRRGGDCGRQAKARPVLPLVTRSWGKTQVKARRGYQVDWKVHRGSCAVIGRTTPDRACGSGRGGPLLRRRRKDNRSNTLPGGGAGGRKRSTGSAYRARAKKRRGMYPGVACVSWSGRRESNSRPSPWQGDALPLSHFRTPRSAALVMIGPRARPCQGDDVARVRFRLCDAADPPGLTPLSTQQDVPEPGADARSITTGESHPWCYRASRVSAAASSFCPASAASASSSGDSPAAASIAFGSTKVT